MTRVVVLTGSERAILCAHRPTRDGGYQGLLRRLQSNLDRQTGRLELSDADQERIARYAFGYRDGGWQRDLRVIFGRTLGPTLGDPIGRT